MAQTGTPFVLGLLLSCVAEEYMDFILGSLFILKFNIIYCLIKDLINGSIRAMY